jgi:polysaccharide chain length determinant protein (PEP-CTERM system associated)
MHKEINNLQDLMAIVKRHVWSIVIPAASLLLIAVIVSLAIPAQYRSTSTILIEDQEIPRDYVASTVTGYAEQRLHTINQRIMSTPKLLEIIGRFNLYADMKSSRTTEEIVARMRKDTKFETISADVIDPRTGRPTPATIAFTLSFEGENASTVQQVANVLASLYLEENLKVREQQTSGTSRFMESEMNDVKKRLDEIDGKIAVFKQSNIHSLPELAQLNFQEMDRVDRDIDQLNAQIRSLREREGYLQSQLASIPTDSASQDKTRLAELRVQLGNLRSRVSEQYPDVKKVKMEIAELEKRMKSSGADDLGTKPDNPAYITLAAQLASTRSEIESVKRQIGSLEKKRGAYSGRIASTPRVEEGYKTLVTERTGLQAKYDDLSKKFMEARVAHGLEKEQKGEKFTIIDAARLPEKPFSPNKPAIILIGLILGLGAGIGTASVREYSDNSVRSVDSLARITGFPVLAAIPVIVTEEEKVQGTGRTRKVVIAAAAGVFGVIVLFHFLVMDLDILWAKLLRRLAI